jgi:hypothetical protein
MLVAQHDPLNRATMGVIAAFASQQSAARACAGGALVYSEKSETEPE